MILPIFMFSRSGNSMVTLSEFYHHRLTSKIQFEPEVLELRGYPCKEFENFLTMFRARNTAKFNIYVIFTSMVVYAYFLFVLNYRSCKFAS